MNNEELFDQIFKDKLENVFIGQPDNAWNKFSRASKMNAARESHFFDQAISRSLSNINTPIIGNEWLAFKNHWDTHTHLIENEFDSQIRNTLQANRLKPDSRALSTLESALSQSNLRNKNLIPSKIIEAILMSIILLLLYMYTPLLQTSNEKSKQTVPSKQVDRASIDQPNTNTQVASLVTLPRIQDKYYSKDLSKNLKVQTNDRVATAPADPDNLMFQNTNSNKSVLNNINVVYNELREKRNDIIEPSINNYYLGNNSFAIQSNPLTQGLNVMRNISNEDNSLIFNKLHNSDIQPRSIYASENYPNYTSIPFNQSDGKKLLSAIWIGFRIGRAFDLIRTPTYSDKGKLVSTQKVQSTILAFNVEVKNDFVNLETGLSYSCKNFGFEGPQNEIAHFINIPLSIKKDFFPSNRFVPYFKVGPDVTIVAAATYKPIVENANRLPKGDQLAAPLSGYPDQKNEDGIINSGKLSTNSFLGIHGSLGFEAKITNSSKITFDISQQINPFEKGIGINNHRFSERSVTLGFKKLLFENLY